MLLFQSILEFWRWKCCLNLPKRLWLLSTLCEFFRKRHWFNFVSFSRELSENFQGCLRKNLLEILVKRFKSLRNKSRADCRYRVIRLQKFISFLIKTFSSLHWTFDSDWYVFICKKNYEKETNDFVAIIDFVACWE